MLSLNYIYLEITDLQALKWCFRRLFARGGPQVLGPRQQTVQYKDWFAEYSIYTCFHSFLRIICRSFGHFFLLFFQNYLQKFWSKSCFHYVFRIIYRRIGQNWQKMYLDTVSCPTLDARSRYGFVDVTMMVPIVTIYWIFLFYLKHKSNLTNKYSALCVSPWRQKASKLWLTLGSDCQPSDITSPLLVVMWCNEWRTLFSTLTVI